MDYTTIRLAKEEMLPHELIVKKVKKYSGSNYGTRGKIYKMAKNQLDVLRLGRVEVDGTTQSVYKFSKAEYDRCEKMELDYQKKQRAAQSEMATKNFGKKKK